MCTYAVSRVALVTPGMFVLSTLFGLLTIPEVKGADCVPTPAGLVGWWKGEGDAMDVTTLHHGALSNGTTYAAGRIGTAFSLDGTNNFVDLGKWSPGSAWTIEAWVNAASTNSTRRMTIAGGVGDGRDWAIGMANGQFGAITKPVGGSTTTVYSGLPVATGVWYHVAGTCDGATAKVYVNGQLQATSPVDPNYVGTTSGTRIGGEVCCAGDNFPGLVDEVAIYSRALTDSEIAGIYNAGTAGKCPLVGAQVPYFTDFETGVGPEWGASRWDNSESLGFTAFTGRFGNDAQYLSLTNLVPGQSYTLGFDFYAIDSWDGSANPGDYFNVAVNGTQVFHYTFGNYTTAQSYPGQPDEGRANFGFGPSYVDAIYRNIEVTFVATNSLTALSFSGQNLEALDNESWGIDNVSVQPTASLTNTFVRSTTLPRAGATSPAAIEDFRMSANWPLSASTATNAANYVLREAGLDGVLGTGDDVLYTLAASSPGAGGRSVAFSISSSPLQAGHYRFETGVGLQDTNGSAVPVFSREFYLVPPVLGVFETQTNNTYLTATTLPVTEAPPGSGFFTAFAVGTFTSTTDVDYWRFDAEAGDVVTVRLESESQGVYPHLRLRNTSDQDLASSDGGVAGIAQIQSFSIPKPGTYLLRAWSANNRSRYWMRVDQSRAAQLEVEDNGTQSTANTLTLTFAPGVAQGKSAGSLPDGDAIDLYRVGVLNPGNAVSVTALYPNGSTLAPPTTVLGVQLDGNVPLATTAGASLNYTVVSNGVHYVSVATPANDLRAQYILNVTVSDGVPPLVIGTSLPDENVVTPAIVDGFSLSFSEELLISTVTNSANYDLRSPGPDGVYNTSDDAVYSVANTGYAGGLSADYRILDGPLQPGKLRLTVSVNLSDRALNKMAAPFVRNFEVVNLPGMVLEGRTNNAAGFGSLLGLTPSATGDGTFAWTANVAAGTYPHDLTVGRVGLDTNLDLVVANYGAGTVSVLTNNGRGSFPLLTNIVVGGGPVSACLVDFNQDGVSDIVSANYDSGTVSVLLGTADPAFVPRTNITGFSRPYFLTVADLNGDGKPDVVVPNNGSASISVLLGNGDATFVRSNYTVGSGPFKVAVGDINGDGKPDLVSANYTASSITLLTNAGNGGFKVASEIPIVGSPRWVAIADVTGDNIPDLVVLQSNERTVAVLAGNGDGTFQPYRSYWCSAQDAYQLLVTDLNQDGRKDIVVPGYGNNQVGILLNDGTGGFTNLLVYGMGGAPFCAAAGDFDNDGRLDLAFSHHDGGYVSVWAGNPFGLLAENPAGSGLRMATGRGTMSSSVDVDFFRFSGNAGEKAMLAVDVPGNPDYSSLNYQVLETDGTVLASFNSDRRGWGQSGTIILPYTGTYVVRVARNHDFFGEYRIRVTIIQPPIQFETESNSTLASANQVVLAPAGNHLNATIAGAITYGDAGDYFNLGNLIGGATVKLGFRRPPTSGLLEVMWIYNGTGTLVTNSLAGATNLSFTVPDGQDGVYYAQVTAAPGGYRGEPGIAVGLDANGELDLGNWFNFQTFTLSMWLNAGASQVTYADILDNNHRSGIAWVIQQDSNLQNHYYWGVADGSPTMSFDLIPNRWQHLAITRDSTNVNRLYLDGVLIGTGSAPGQIAYNGSQYVRVGAWGGGGRNWQGAIDDLRIWGKALSQPEIVAGMSGTLSGNEADLLGYWPFSEGVGVTSADLSASNHPAAFSGGARWLFVGATNAAAPGLLSEYLLDIDLASPRAPTITAVTLPADGSTNYGLISDFTVRFSEDMNPAFTALRRDVLRYNGHSYLVTDAATTWAAAEAQAVALGGHLAAVNDAAENAWIASNFSRYGTVWIGLTDAAREGDYAWTSGDAATFSNWSSGQPSNSYGVEDYTQMYGNGMWNDADGTQALRGVVEIAGTADLDNDGWVDVLDPYPADPLNAFDLRAAGPDEAFDTPDDQIYRVYCGNYTQGLVASFAVADGPLQPGNYRFKVTTSLRDRFGGALAAPYLRYFTIAPISGFTVENRRGPDGSSATTAAANIGSQPDGSFSPFSSYSTAVNPSCVISGKLNGDTNLDLVTANYNSGSITLWMGKGDGSFQATTNIATGGGPVSAVLADFNSDGKPDLAVANYSANTVSILLGNGLGDFVVFTNIPGLSNPRYVAAADFNQDGKVDLAVASAGAGQVAVFNGNGDGTFQAPSKYATGTGPQAVAVGDLNGDTLPDLAVANYNASTVTVLLNTNGVFTVGTNCPTPSYCRSVAILDLNGDNKPDLVALADNGAVSVFAGSGDGTFAARTDYSAGNSTLYDCAVGDIDGDGRPDLAIANQGNSWVTTLLAQPVGSLGSRVDYPIAGNPTGVALGDFNGDGRLDFATVGYNNNTLSIYLGNDRELLALDPAGTGLRTAAVRGNVADGNDLDYWTFSASAGQKLMLTTENPGYPSGSQLLYRLYRPDGSQWTYFYTDGNGRAQGGWTVPASGTYSIRVEQSDAYAGEYRFRLTLADPAVQMESEDNSAIASADPLSLYLVNGQRVATAFGGIPAWDGNGDYYQLGNLGVGTQVKLDLAQPATSGLGAQLELYNGTQLAANNHPSASNLVYTIGAGGQGAYYVRVVGKYATHNSWVTNALFLDGGSTYVNLGNWAPGSKWTVQTWAMPTALPSGRHLLLGAASENRDYGLVLQDGKFGMLVRQTNGSVASILAPEVAAAGAWYHVAATCDGTNAYLYVNGLLRASSLADTNYATTASGTWLGAAVCCGGQVFPGAAHDASIWRRALTQAEVLSTMATSPAGSEPDLAGVWKLDSPPGTTTVLDLSTNGHNGVLVNGAAFQGLAPAGTRPGGLLQQYLLNITLVDTIPPEITAVSLPPEASISSNIVDRFLINFSEDMAAATVNSSANYELRNAGPDNAFLTADDDLYRVTIPTPYVAGTSASYLVADGPLQPGRYRFTVRTNLTDSMGTFLAAAYVRNFSVANLPGYVFEARNNDSFGLPTSLSFNRTNRADGSLISASTLGVGGDVQRVAAGGLDGDTNTDLVAAVWDGNVSVLLGNGDGTFRIRTNYSTGLGTFAVALGYFDSDTNLDLAVGNYNANTVSVFTGNGDGTFQVRSNYSVGKNPYQIVVADVNQDGKADLVIPINGAGNVSVLLGTGTGTFAPAVNYPVGISPMYVAVGDVNGDGKVDLVVANYGDNDVSLLLGNGDGTFAPALGLAAGLNPRAVVLADLNKDGKPDIAVLNGGDDTISVMMGNGDGSFQPRVNYAAGTSDGFELLAADVSSDGWPDLVAGGYNNSLVSVLLNRGAGVFQGPSTYGAPSRVIGLAAGDYNNDGRLDIAAGSNAGKSLTVFLGRDFQPLDADPATGLRIATARGNIRDGSDTDYWSFDAAAGDRILFTCTTPGLAGYSSALYRFYYPGGQQWTYTYSDYYGQKQFGLVAPVSGTYTIRVEQSDAYFGEYRFSVAIASAPVQVEAEDNNNIGQANSPSLQLADGHRQATLLGALNTGDPGDVYRLGVLSSNSVVNLGLRQPLRSGFADILEVMDPSGAVALSSGLGAAQLSYVVPPGADGVYYARVRALAGALPPAAQHATGGAKTVLYDGGSYSEVMINVPEDAMTVSFWFRTLDPNAGLFSVQGGGHDRHVYLAGGNIRTRIYSGGTVGSSGLALGDGAWHYVVFTFGSAIGGNRTYVDGVQVISDSKANSDFTWQDRIRFGYSDDATDHYLNGQLDEARLWSRAFTPGDVAQNMTNALTGTEPGLIGYWRFNEGQGTLSPDQTTNSRNAVFVGNPLWVPVNSGFVTAPGILAHYLLDLDLADATPPAITSLTLPAGGSTNYSMVDRFSLGFSRDVDQGINGLTRDIRIYGDHNYLLTSAANSWYGSELQAQAAGGHLATINDALENSWLASTFGAVGNLWIGFSDEAQKGKFLWASGEPVAYTNWTSGTPDYANNKDYTFLRSGTWANATVDTSYRAIIEVAGADSDNDGLVDSVDTFPNDPYNLFDLRAAGPDGVFDTADDDIYHVLAGNYTGGLSLDFGITDGPLQPGSYRFMVTSSLRDLFGNPMPVPFTRYFTVAGVPGYVVEGRTNNSPASATPLPLVEDPPGLKSAAGRGNISNSQQTDYWSFSGTAGDWFKLATYVPGSPGASSLTYRLLRVDGSSTTQVFSWASDYNGDGETGVYTLSATTNYLLAVSYSYSYSGEYRFRVTTGSPSLQAETEDNGSIATADVFTFGTTGAVPAGSVAGRIRVAGDLDYYNLGTVTNGSSLFLNVRQPGSSTFPPVVSVYSAAGVYQPEAAGGRSTDGVANVPVTVTGNYYAVVRSGDGSGGLNEQYVLDVQVVPTGSINFPNLVVSSVYPPSGSGILSGQMITYSFLVTNVGNAGTVAANWIDRAVLSTDQVLGNGDDIALGFITHQGSLAAGAGYGVTNTFVLPEGTTGDYYLIVQCDAGNAVNEYLFEADNVTISASPFHIGLAPYPDLVVENLSVSGPDDQKTYTVTWNTANRGTAVAPGGFSERFLVRNQGNGNVLVNSEFVTPGNLDPGSVLARVQTVTATNAGIYLVQVSTDSKNTLFEYNASGHAAAEANNTVTTNFQITAYYTVALQSSPPGAGTPAGAGTYPSGNAVSVSAAPNTNILPYVFVNWTEGGSFQSANSNYSFLINRDRVLTANFTLPTFLISATNYPPGAGTVAGQGTYFYGTTNVLSASSGLGYKFTNWTENGAVISTVALLTNIVTSNRFLQANYVEANTAHYVTTGTSPTNLVSVAGSGLYTNAQTARISTAVSVTNPPNIYNFRQFRLNGAWAGDSASFDKTFSTLDPTNMQYIAFYDTVSILPLVTNVTVNLRGVIPATTNLLLAFQFNRSMDTNFTPRVLLTNSAASVQPVIPSGGKWGTNALADDTFFLPPVTLGQGMDGLMTVQVSGAQDLGGGVLAVTNVLQFTVDVTPPLNPLLTLSASNSASATVSWSGYSPPSDLNSFRLYLGTSPFNSVAGMTAVSSLGAAGRSFTYSGLSLDTRYYAAVTAVDSAGNSAPGVAPLAFTLTSTVPPPVPVQVTAVGSSTASVSWQSYSTASLLGFAGFNVYYERTNFTSVAGLTVRRTFGVPTRSFQVDNLDRSETWYFAVVGYNVNSQFNPAVATARWTDPYAGAISANITLDGGDQKTVDVLQSITVVNNAVVTIPAGTTVRFAPGTSLTIESGALRAEGTPLDPILLTSAADRDGSTPAAGDWGGVLLGKGAGGSILRNVFVNFGGGLTVSNSAPVVDAFTALNNTPAGLTVRDGAALNTTNALLAYNAIGAQQLGSGLLAVVQSSIKNNGTNGLAQGGLTLRALQDWWGSAVSTEIDASLRGAVERTGYLSGEPLLTPAIGTSNNVTQVGGQAVDLRQACRTADTMRVSEDSAFNGVFFTPFAPTTKFALSAGGGQKTIFAQFRSVTGQTSTPVAISVTYITSGPSIASFSLFEGEVLTRPLMVSGSASAALGMDKLEFYVDGAGLATNNGGSFSYWFDPRNLSSDVHRVQLVARDNSGNVAVAAHNVTIIPTPPPQPLIYTPSTDLVVATNSISITGSAEPFVEVRLFRSGSRAGTTDAASDGSFSFVNVPLVEGPNEFTAVAVDALGSASSLVREVTLDTIPPARLVMDAPSYTPNLGLTLAWHYASTGKRAGTFQVFWSTVPISSAGQATGQTLALSTMTTRLQGLATANYYFYVVGYDALGNSSGLSDPVQFAYDGVAPSFSVSYDKPSPVGAGKVHLVLSASEALSGIPSLTVQPYGSAPALLPLVNTALNTYEADINVTAMWSSGLVLLRLAGSDLAGNSFNGAPSGPSLVVDVTPPSAVITTAPTAPIQATNNAAVTVSVQLTEPPQAGTTPEVSFGPPIGAQVPVPLTGSGTNWLGSLTVTPAMGSGVGHFVFTGYDSLSNVGHRIISGTDLEIYNTALPSAPGQPVHFEAASLAGGRVQLTWSNVPNAEIYRVYAEPGTNFLIIPTTMIADNVTSNNFVDLESADGYYRYVVTASRRGAEGTNSIVRVALSDRTGPPAPTGVAVQLVATGLQISWQPGQGEQPYSYRVYRNSSVIRSQGTAAPVIDNPPRGTMNYVVASVDALGNETPSTAATFQLLVGAVNNLQALVDIGQAPQLTWTSPDPTAVGFNVYRNGIKQNGAILTTTSFTDSLPLGDSTATYAVTAVNSTNAESAARSVMVLAGAVDLLVNAGGGTVTGPPITMYFDDYQVSVSNTTVDASLPLADIEVVRQIAGTDALTLLHHADTTIGSGNFYQASLALPSASVAVAQTVRVRALQQTGIEGSTVIYQRSYSFPAVQVPSTMVEVSVNSLPLAGGLTDFNLKVYNRGFKPMYFVATRQSGSKPGDVFVSVKNPEGQEVSRTEYLGTPAGAIFYGDVGYVMVAPGGSTSLLVKDVFVPESLASNTVTFQAVVSTIYDRVSPVGQQRSGPLSGTMQSLLSQTPYFGTAQTDFLLYSNSQPVVITGQALDRATGLPTPNVPLNLGFGTRGYSWNTPVTTDASGNYRYVYDVQPGLAGTLTIWAAHPDVYDKLNQAQIQIYRIYANPSAGDIRMSKNDTLPFKISLLNPGDIALTGFKVGCQAYQLNGTNRVPVATVTGQGLQPNDFNLAPGERREITLQLAAAAEAPDNAIVEFAIQSEQGAATVFTGNVTLLPAVPLISVLEPAIGYVEISMDRGGLQSREVTVVNRGLKDLQGVTLLPATNVTWMRANLPALADGTIPLPDLAVGQSNTFTVVFTPPTNAVLGFFQDKMIIRGTNAQSSFAVNLYARVTSASKGAVQFYVDNILGLDVPNAAVRLRNTALGVELPPFYTDLNGFVTVTNLQEGEWSWQITAPGHSGNVGLVTVIADQTVNVSTRLSKSVVTVNFTVTPVPFTDRYEITIEQTFETHVPLPVLILKPTYQHFENVDAGFQVSFIVTAKNEGLIQMSDLTITGMENSSGSFTPLINYVPVLLPQQSIEIPFTFTYSGTNGPGPQGWNPTWPALKCAGIGDMKEIAGFIDGMNAIANAWAQCAKDRQAIAIAATVAITYQLVTGITKGAKAVVGALQGGLGLAKFLGCILGKMIGSLPTVGIPLAILTDPPKTSAVTKFEPIQAGCFAPDTRILLADGTSKTIDRMKAGDRVKSGSSRSEVSTVAEVYSRPDNTCREIAFALPAQPRPDLVRTTDEHWFWKDGKGWVLAAEIRAGDWLINEHGQRVRVLSNQRLPGASQVYNLKLHGDTAFYANGVLVHDLCGAWASDASPPESSSPPLAPTLEPTSK